MHEVLVNRLGGLSLPRKSVVRLTDRPDMTLDVYRGRKPAMQQQQQNLKLSDNFKKGNNFHDFCWMSFEKGVYFKGRFLLFQVYRNFAYLFYKLSVSTFYKEINTFQQKVHS